MRVGSQNIAMSQGFGWIKEDVYGCATKRLQWQYTDLRSFYAQLLKDTILTYALENFGRLNQESRLVAFSIALALYDANISYSFGQKQDIGILGTSPDGALTANLAYFNDYVACGRKLGRGNLFIYTLPSSPLAEAAIHFGLEGPLLYMRHNRNPENNILERAEFMVRNKDAQSMLAVIFDAHEARCHCVLGAGA